MQDFEQLGMFYLGRSYDLPTRTAGTDLLLYEAKDLTTHAVCVGMTGSGKTGLCLDLLEEAAIDGIPAIAIDPKGDLGNLLLTFPQLRAEDFRPWIDPAEATRSGDTPEQYAEKTAQKWQAGLADWGQDGARITRLRDAVEMSIYTPGSQAGLPLAVLKSFGPPPAAILENNEALRERIISTASGLLALLQISGDPLRSREHLLLGNLFERAWRAGKELDLGSLIRDIQSPPFDKLGMMDLESVFPAKDRFELALGLNGLLASPGFATWLEGEPLDVQNLLYTPTGKPKLSIISIAHLGESERMFFVTLLLNEVLTWVRTQPGTSSLRAILYMDEVFGYFPPTANPPSKLPMLTLLKQARAYGLGIVLATQNPVDLDYKGLSNAGTWFLGRLQTERDKARVLDGLEGASAAAGSTFDRQQMETLISGLGQRVFLMNNVHDDAPAVFQTRWSLSYLRGPLTRTQITELMRPQRAALPAATTGSSPATAGGRAVLGTSSRPVLPPGIVEQFLARRGTPPAGATLVYRPTLLGVGRVHFVQAASAVDLLEPFTCQTSPLDEGLSDLPWTGATITRNESPLCVPEPESTATFATLPAALAQAKTYKDLVTPLKSEIYRTHRLEIWQSALLGTKSDPGELLAKFKIRVANLAHEARDRDVEKLRQKYAPKLAAIQEQVRKAQQRTEKEQSQSKQQTFQSVISIGSSILGAVFGRKLNSSANANRAATSARAAGRILREQQDVGQAQENLEAAQHKQAELEAEFESDRIEIQQKYTTQDSDLESIALKPKKADIDIGRVSLLWTPWIKLADGTWQPAD